MQTLAVEIGREAATILMLAAVALAVAGNAGDWAAAFVIAFGTWDITFYVFLRMLLHWPGSLFTWDILFLIPVPWVGPVLAPVLVSAAMIGAGIWHFHARAEGAPVRIGAAHWFGILGGAAIIILAFAIDCRNIMAGGMPGRFHWEVFLIGLCLAILAYLGAAVGPRRRAGAAIPGME